MCSQNGGTIFTMNDSGWMPLGRVSEDGMTISTSTDDAPWKVDSSLIRSTETFECSFDVDGSLLQGVQVDKALSLAMEVTHLRRCDILRDRANRIGGMFLRNYLKSQKRSRRNTKAPTEPRKPRKVRYVIDNCELTPNLSAGEGVTLSVTGGVRKAETWKM